MKRKVSEQTLSYEEREKRIKRLMEESKRYSKQSDILLQIAIALFWAITLCGIVDVWVSPSSLLDRIFFTILGVFFVIIGVIYTKILWED